MKRQGQKLNLIGGAVSSTKPKKMSEDFYNDCMNCSARLLSSWKKSERRCHASQRTPRNPANALYLQFTEGHLDCVV